MQTHRIEQRYVAAVEMGALESEGVFEDRLKVDRDGRARISESGSLKARTRYRLLERRSDRALVELFPETGWTHQLRAQLASRGAAVAGDTLYGGAVAARLMLHAESLRLPALGRSFHAALPEELNTWVHRQEPGLASPQELRRKVADAGCRRNPLHASATAFRLVNDLGDGAPGLCIDRYGDFAVLSISNEEAFRRRLEIAQVLLDFGARGVYIKVRQRVDLRRRNLQEYAPQEPLLGERAPDPLVVSEDDLRMEVILGAGFSTGLFVEQRENRRRLKNLSAGARVLNLFCYTCGFGVASALGHASSTVNVDLSARALERGQRNFALNGIDVTQHRFVRADVLDWLLSAGKDRRFDLIIVDPPSFATVRKKIFRVSSDFEKLLTICFTRLAPGGQMLAVTNHRRTSLAALRRLVHVSARRSGRELAQLKNLAAPLDCPARPDGDYPMRSVLVTVR
jgi:23S rRNA (cytosine1962-C5)-methyltransferase